MLASKLASDSRQHAKDAAVPAFRAALLGPYLDCLRQIGAPVQGLLRDAKLPTMAGEEPEMALPMSSTFRFLRKAATSQGIDMSLRPLRKLSITRLSPRFLAAAAGSPTLNVALSHFQRLVREEDPQVRFWFDAGDAHAALNMHYRLPLNAVDQRTQDWSELMVLIAIVRAFAGSEWQPTQLSLRSPLEIGRYAQEEFPNTRILVSQSVSSILLPNEYLSLPPRHRNFSGDHAEGPGGANPASAWQGAGLTESLKAVLASYLADGKPPIELAAELSDMSTRTLQRRLHKASKTYSDLVDEIQFARAERLLRETDEKIIDIAIECGYGDSSHFARAFRRISGVNPRAFRRQCQSGALGPVDC